MITGYGAGYVNVNGQRFERHLIVTPTQIVHEWLVEMELSEAALPPVLQLAPQIVLFGTGKTLRFPPPSVLKRLIVAKVGYEFMDTQAACRTYNILLEEGRNVVAALLVV